MNWKLGLIFAFVLVLVFLVAGRFRSKPGSNGS